MVTIGISLFGVIPHSGLYEFYICALSRSDTSALRKSPICALWTKDRAFFWSLHKIHDHRCWSEQRPI